MGGNAAGMGYDLVKAGAGMGYDLVEDTCKIEGAVAVVALGSEAGTGYHLWVEASTCEGAVADGVH